MNNLQHVTQNSNFFNWIPALKLSISSKQYICSGEPLSDKVMNVIISKFNNLMVPFSKEGHNHQLQPFKGNFNHFVLCYKEVDGSFVQVLTTYQFQWVVATNSNLCVTPIKSSSSCKHIWCLLEFFVSKES